MSWFVTGAAGGTQPVAACWSATQVLAQAGRRLGRREPDWAVVSVREMERRRMTDSERMVAILREVSLRYPRLRALWGAIKADRTGTLIQRN